MLEELLFVSLAEVLESGDFEDFIGFLVHLNEEVFLLAVKGLLPRVICPISLELQKEMENFVDSIKELREICEKEGLDVVVKMARDMGLEGIFLLAKSRVGELKKRSKKKFREYKEAFEKIVSSNSIDEITTIYRSMS